MTRWIDARPTCAMSLVLALSSPALATAPMPASPSLADMSLEELSNIEITSVSRRAQPLSDAAAAIFVITADDIRRSGATSLPEALRLAPNLQVAEPSNGRYAISARGFNGPEASKLLVMIDGRSVYTPLFAGVFWDAQDVVLQDVARIEVISGPGGTLWGVNAVNGVINVITKPAHETQGSMVVAGGGSRGAQTSVRHGSSLANGGAFRVHARHFYMKRSETENGSDVEDAWHMSHAGFRLDWQNGGDTFSANGQVQQSEQEQAAPGIFEIRGLPLELLPVKSRAVNLTARWQHRVNGGGEISTQVYVDHTERTVPIAFDQKLTISDIQLQYVRPRSGRHSWVIGGEYRVASDRVANSSFIGFIPQKAMQEWISFFAQDEINLRQNLRLILGGRLESNDYTGVEWLPNARLAWKPAHEHLLWAAMSRTVRAPSRIDRDAFIPYPAAFPWPLPGFTGPRPAYLLGGGPEVKAEVAKVMSVGWRGQPTPDTSLSITAYRALYEHLHTQELGGSRGLLIFAGRMRGFTSGLEAWGSWQARPGWRLSAGFNGMYQRFYLNSDSTDTAESLPLARGRDPARTWQLRSAWDLPAGHEIDLTVRHVAWIPRNDVPGYVTADLRWGWRMRPGVELSLTGRNLIGRGHAEYLAASTRSFWRPSVHAQAVVQF